MDVVDLRPDLRLLRGVPGQAYLLRHRGGVTLIDTGQMGQGEIVAAALRDWGLDRDSLTCVVLTHWHADHTGSAAEIAEWPRVRVLAHKADAPVIRGTAVGALPLTGEYDASTLVAVQKFQRQEMPGVEPTGHFGVQSREALRRWYAQHTQTSDGYICVPNTGFGCDEGAVEEGLHLGFGGQAVKPIACGVVGVGAGAAAGAVSDGTLAGAAGLGAGVFCDLVIG